MNTSSYGVGRSYDQDPRFFYEKDQEVKSKEISSNTEDFKNLVDSIASKTINKINRSETEKLISSLRSRVTGQKGDPESEKLDKAIQKIRMREEMALSKSVSSESKKRHGANIQFLEKVMYANQIEGSTTKNLLYQLYNDCIKLCEIINKKSINQIKSSEVENLVNFQLQIGELLVELKIGRQDVESELLKSMREQYQTKDEPVYEQAISKLLEREEMALDHSTLNSSKTRHENNIRLLKLIKSGRLY